MTQIYVPKQKRTEQVVAPFSMFYIKTSVSSYNSFRFSVYLFIFFYSLKSDKISNEGDALLFVVYPLDEYIIS